MAGLASSAAAVAANSAFVPASGAATTAIPNSGIVSCTDSPVCATKVAAATGEVALNLTSI